MYSLDHGMIQGAILDRAQSPIHEATIRVLREPNQVVTVVISNEDGSFQVKHLPEGVYRVRAKAAGFKERTIDRVVVKARIETRMGGISLEVAGCDDPSVLCCLEVTAELPKPAKNSAH
jgi:myo-inositol-hexaphosphate 3-phosphohydrolase